MIAGNMISNFASSVVLACTRDLPNGPYQTDEVDVLAYVDGFGDTSLGRDGISGQMMTSCLTVCVNEGEHVAVYRAGSLDFVAKCNREMCNDLRNQCVAEYRRKGKYELVKPGIVGKRAGEK